MPAAVVQQNPVGGNVGPALLERLDGSEDVQVAVAVQVAQGRAHRQIAQLAQALAYLTLAYHLRVFLQPVDPHPRGGWVVDSFAVLPGQHAAAPADEGVQAAIVVQIAEQDRPLIARLEPGFWRPDPIRVTEVAALTNSLTVIEVELYPIVN